MEDIIDAAKELGLEPTSFKFTGPQSTSFELTALCRKTLDQTLRFKTTVQCEVSDLFESLRDFGGGWMADSPRATNTKPADSTAPPADNEHVQTEAEPGAPPLQEPETTSSSNKPPDYLGLDVWPAALELCAYIARHPELVQGRDVIELGAGVGLPGLLAAKLGARKSLLTDYEQSVVDFSQNNAALNNISHLCSAFKLDWTRLDTLSSNHLHSYNLILAADVLYVEELMPYFIDSALALMTPNAILLAGHQTRRALVIDPETGTPEVQDRDVAFQKFQALCEGRGLALRVLGSRESPEFPGPLYMLAVSMKENCGRELENLPAASDWFIT